MSHVCPHGGIYEQCRDCHLRMLDPDTLPVPIGRVRRKWWRLGMLSGLAVAASALAALDEVKP